MLRLVHEAERYDDEMRARHRTSYANARRQEEDQDSARYERPRPSAIARAARSLWLALAFTVVGTIAYLAGNAGVLGPLLHGTPVAPAAARVAPVAVTQAAAVPPAAAPAAPQLPVPNVQGLAMMIRNAVIALHQANISGNYAVLRALAAPDFQAKNNVDVLAQAFKGLRDAKLDLAQVAAVNPRLYSDPTIDDNGFLHLSGFVPLGDAKADFQLAYQMINGRWQLFGIGLNPPTDPIAKPAATRSSAKKVPDDPTLMALIRNAVLGLNQANTTGDYSVLRAVASSGFQKTNSVAQLGDAFANIRARGLDLSPAAVIDPRLFRPATIDNNGYLRLAGYFPSQPEVVNFDLAFQFEAGQWRLFGIGVDTAPAQPPAAATAAQ